MGTLVSLLIVGLSTSFTIALLGRLFGGALNGNIGVIQTMVSELVVNPKHERMLLLQPARPYRADTVTTARAYAVMPFVWTIGTIIGPCIGGYFAEPAVNFPDTFSKHGIFGRFPYLLPNLICAGLMLLSVILGWLLLEETCERSALSSDMENQRLLYGQPHNALIDGAVISQDGYGTFAVPALQTKTNDSNATGHGDATGSKILTRRVVMLTIALGIFTYHSMTFDHLLPIFLQDRKIAGGQLHAMIQSTLEPLGGGLGMTTQQTGVVMSINGIIALVIQAVIFPIMADWLGVWRLFTLVTICHPLAYILMPGLTLLSDDLVYLGLYGCLALRNLLSILAFPLLLILIKDAAPSKSCLGRINGLAASTGAACRTMASPVAGFLYGLGMTMRFTAIAWLASALVAVVGAIQLASLSSSVATKTALPSAPSNSYAALMKSKSVTVIIEEVDSGYDTDTDSG